MPKKKEIKQEVKKEAVSEENLPTYNFPLQGNTQSGYHIVHCSDPKLSFIGYS